MHPYTLTAGGASLIGCWGYIEAWREMMEQVCHYYVVLLPTSFQLSLSLSITHSLSVCLKGNIGQVHRCGGVCSDMWHAGGFGYW